MGLGFIRFGGEMSKEVERHETMNSMFMIQRKAAPRLVISIDRYLPHFLAGASMQCMISLVVLAIDSRVAVV